MGDFSCNCKDVQMLNYDAKFKYLSSMNPFDGTQKRKIYGGGEALR
jgi:hypothetical protein